MKVHLPSLLGALLVGIGVGWLLRGGPAGTDPEKTSQVAASAPAKSAEKANGSAVAANGGGSDAESGKSRVRQPAGGKPEVLTLGTTGEDAERMMNALQDQQNKRNETRVAGLVAKLGLNPQQEAKLREYFDRQTPKFNVAKEGGAVKVDSKLPDKTESLDDLMKGLLTADQAKDYDKFKEAEQNQKVEGRVLREMASLAEAVDLRPEQRDAVYEILRNDAQENIGKGSPMEITEGFGFAAAHLEIGGGAEVSKEMALKVEDSGPVDPEVATKRLLEEHQARVDAQVNRLSGVLDAAQLAQYRGSLEQGSLIFAP